MTYLIYARKYRPQTFEEVIGQKPVVQTLQNAIKNDRVAQAYIFSGMRGVGKTTAARILAKALNCQQGPAPIPCNKCEQCRAINEDRSVDVLEIDGASNRGIDEVRSLREGVKYKPIHSRFKVIIIDEVHMLTREAFNALLKTLEEPPPHTTFIFATTEFHKVPATIKSRCQHFEFKKISHKDIINHLNDIATKEKINITPIGLNLIAEAAEGSLRDAQSLLDQAVAFSGESISDDDLKEILGVISRDLLFAFSTAIIKETPDRIFPLIEDVIDNGYDLRFFYKELIQHFRNLLLVIAVEKPQELLSLGEEDLERLKQESNKSSSEEILRYLVVLQQGEQGIRYSTHPRIFLEVLLVKLCHFKKVTPLKDILEELALLKKGLKTSSEVPANPVSSFQEPEKQKRETLPPPVTVQESEQIPVEKEDKKDIFSELLDRLQAEKSYLAALLSQLSSHKFKEKETQEGTHTLEIFFSGGKDFLKEKLLKEKKVLQDMASDIAGSKVEVKILEEVIVDEGKRDREVEKALRDPTVQYFMDTFKAQILSVEPVKRTKK